MLRRDHIFIEVPHHSRCQGSLDQAHADQRCCHVTALFSQWCQREWKSLDNKIGIIQSARAQPVNVIEEIDVNIWQINEVITIITLIIEERVIETQEFLSNMQYATVRKQYALDTIQSITQASQKLVKLPIFLKAHPAN